MTLGNVPARWGHGLIRERCGLIREWGGLIRGIDLLGAGVKVFRDGAKRLRGHIRSREKEDQVHGNDKEPNGKALERVLLKRVR